ncbi:MAG TPA: Asp-tRNA(Asn)/Glu-tRNA(Gln) amidotransferase subunit GatC [Candidatus Saccharimonadales bacterium]|nr:Asp-tRNA(Asn)/Glu-tRNA(Gln) amidotransferase subunit GatC [Candidatus Saccharimonadales bacterium]
MSKIDENEVRRLAELAKIGLSPEEVKNLTHDLDAIVGMVDKLQSVDTTGVIETSQVTGLRDVWRPDKVVPSQLTQAELLKNAPATQDGYIKVRRVL